MKTLREFTLQAIVLGLLIVLVAWSAVLAEYF
jgi:hypothetical protein